MLQTLKLDNVKWKNLCFTKKKSLVGLTPGGVTENNDKQEFSNEDFFNVNTILIDFSPLI